MEQLVYWGISTCLFLLGGFVLFIALLRLGIGSRENNSRLAELIWQARSRDTEWWLRVDKRGGLKDEDEN